MAPSKWDDESEESTPPSSPPPTRRGKFEDEEDSDVLESWDAAEDSEVEREKAKKAEEAKAKAEAEAKANRKSKSQRVAEHQAENARRRQELEDDSSEEEDEADRRRRLLQEERDSDLKHAEDLLGGNARSKAPRPAKHITVADPSNPTNSIDLTTLSIFDPKTKDQFTQLRDTVGPLLAGNSKKAQYVVFLQELSKSLCKDLKSDEIKKISSALTTLSNEKMREEKLLEKGGKKSKAAKTKTTLNTTRDAGAKADTNAYDEFDDDDFM